MDQDLGKGKVEVKVNPSLLLSLPSEIRLMIFEYVLATYRSQEPHRPVCRLKLLWLMDGKWASSPSSTAFTKRTKVEDLALSCRQVYEEIRTMTWQAWEATEIDLSSCVPIGAISFFKDAKTSYLQHLRFLRIDWAALIEGVSADLDARLKPMRNYLCSVNAGHELVRLHCLVDTNYDAFVGVYESFVGTWESLTNVETFAAEWTTKCRSSVDFRRRTEAIRTQVHPSHRVTVQYDVADYNYEYPSLIVSKSRPTYLGDRLPELYPYVDRISDLD